MVSTVIDHYAKHLAPIYSWMVGDFDAACAAADALYTEIGVCGKDGRLAIDLGCGHGIHSVALARRGFRVTSMDTSAHLLAELTKHSLGLDIRAVEDDLCSFRRHLREERPYVICCMGDTLTHLPSQAAVDTLLADAAQSVAKDGCVILSLRDYVTTVLQGEHRFIPIRADANRIHTCFLDYQGDVVHVYDMVHTMTAKGWQTVISSYPKLRLSIDALIITASRHGLALIHRSTTRGMVYLAFAPQVGG